jgi:hypothetical protein
MANEAPKRKKSTLSRRAGGTDPEISMATVNSPGQVAIDPNGKGIDELE